MKFFNKLRWVLGILMVFVLIAATNLIDRDNFGRIRDSVVSIYEDRLVAKNLIFEMSNLLHEKELALALNDTTFFNRRNVQVNAEMSGIITSFEATEMTAEEMIVFKGLREDYAALQSFESSLSEQNFEKKEECSKHLLKLREDLQHLASIQLTEGSKQMAISQRAMDTVELFTNLEIYIMIFLAIVVQIIVIYKPD